MGCSSSFEVANVEGHSLGGTAAAPYVLTRKDSFGQRVREPAIAFAEPSRSFDSMSHKLTSRDSGCALPPVAATHSRHVAKLEKFLDAIPSHSATLKREVQIRRSRLGLD
mmetsp:Transcript_115595/g.274724  ORF Transcript_115595/g.274724 Transcript_115595/m.274724 type:complete len:110 (+) Transcript_115595:58-387(+)